MPHPSAASNCIGTTSCSFTPSALTHSHGARASAQSVCYASIYQTPAVASVWIDALKVRSRTARRLSGRRGLSRASGRTRARCSGGWGRRAAPPRILQVPHCRDDLGIPPLSVPISRTICVLKYRKLFSTWVSSGRQRQLAGPCRAQPVCRRQLREMLGFQPKIHHQQGWFAPIGCALAICVFMAQSPSI